MRRTREFHGGGGSPPMQRNNNQGYDLDESSHFLDLDLSWSSGTQGRPRTTPDNLLVSTNESGAISINRHLEDMRRRSQEAEFAATFQAHCVDGSAYATYEDLSMLTVDTMSASVGSLGEGTNSPIISGPGTPITPTSPLLLDDSFRRLNKSVESVLIAVAAAESDADKNDSQAPRRHHRELSLRPLERSRSLENLHSPSYESTLCLSDGDIERHDDVNNNDNVEQQEQGNTSACAADANLLRELGPRATTGSGSESENTTGTASRVDEPLIERSFADVAETCRITPVQNEHLQTTTDQRLLQHTPHMDDGSDGDEDTEDDRSSNHQVNPGIYPAVVTKQSEPECVKEEVLLLSEETMTESKMMAKMPHDIVMAPPTEQKTISEGGAAGGVSGSGQAEIPSIAFILEAVRNNQPDKVVNRLQAVKERLDTAECMADDLLDQNTALRTEVAELELEIEEAKDHYRQSDVEEYREIKADLDRAIKDYRVLQYRLRKAERKSEEAENQKQQYEEKLKESGGQGSGDSSPDQEKSTEIIGLQQELKVAKEVSIRLHQELEMIEDKRAKTEDENQILRRKLAESEALRKDLKRDLEKTRTELYRTEVDILRRKLSQSYDEDKSKELKAKIRVLRSSASSDDGDALFEYDMAALLNDLQESAERERDLQNQLHLLDEEAAVIRKNIDSIEQEKEALDFELERYKMRFGTLDEPKRPDNGKGVGSEKEAELRLQLMMTEQEATVMRRRIVELEGKIEELQGVPEPMDTSVPEEDKKVLPQRQSPVGEESTELRKQMQDIEAETDALKRQLEQVLRENEALRVKLETFEELNTIYPVDTKDATDPQKKLVQAETVIASLKKRIVDVEFTFRCLQLEAETLRKLTDVTAKEGSKGKAKAAENKLRAQVNVLKGEADFMRRKIVEVELQNDRLHEELKKQSSKAPSVGEGEGKHRTESTSSDGDSDRLATLQEKIGGLEEELGDLLLIVKSKEVTQEQQEKELIQARQESVKLREETQARESLYQDQLASLQSQRDVLEHQLLIVGERAQKVEEDLKRVSPSGQPQKGIGMAEPAAPVTSTTVDDVFAAKTGIADVTAVNYEKCLKDRIDSLEKQLAEERQRCRVAEKRAEMLNGDEGPSPISLSFDAAYKEREKELLRFELNECHLTIEDLKTEITKEKEQRARERAEYEQQLREMAEDRGRTIERHALEKESSELQRKMESLAWRRERAALSKRVAQLKTKVVALQDRVSSPPISETDEGLSEHEAKLRALTADAEKEELKGILEKLEAEVAILDNECWKYREVAEEMQARMNKLTAQNEELQASSDILTQERTLLHTKLATAQQEKSEIHVKFKKDKDAWERERAEIRSTLAQQDMALKDAQCMLGRLQVVKETLEKRNKELEAVMSKEKQQAKQIETVLKEKEAALYKLQSPQERASKPASEVPDGREFEIRARTKTRQLEELHENLNRANRELDNGKERLRELEFSLRQREHTLVTERLELVSEASTQSDSESSAKEDSRLLEELEILRQRLQSKERDWRSERSELRDAVDKLQSSLKAREASWESERSKLRADVKSLKTRQIAKEESWKAERAKFLNDVGELRKHLKARDSDLEKNRDLLKRLEAQTELVESYREGEAKFKEERRRLLQQIEDKGTELNTIQRERDGLQRSLDNQQRRIEHARQEVLDQHTREEKIWKSEISASRFKLEAESKYFKDEIERLKTQVNSEAIDRDVEKETLDQVTKELDRLRGLFDDELKKKESEKEQRAKESELVKKSKEFIEDFQRDKRSFNQQLTEERNRFDTLQRTYAADKATWDVCRNEMQAKISRLEGQTKTKKVKKDDLQTRMQAAWEQERGENRRLVTEANHNSLETQRQMDALSKKKQREMEIMKENFEKERIEWRNEKGKINEHMHKLEEEICRLKDNQKRTTQLELRFQRERESWRRERNDAQRRLQDSLSTRRMEHNRIDAILTELEQLKNPSIGKEVKQPEPITTAVDKQFPRSKTPPPISPKKTPPAPPPRTFRASAKVKAIPRSPERSSSLKEGAPVRQLLRQVSDPASLHDASAQVEQSASGSGVKEAGGCMATSHTFEEATAKENADRSKSHSDVYGKTKAPPVAVKATSSVRELSKPMKQEVSTAPPTKPTSGSVQILTTERAPFQTGDALREVKIHSRSAEVLTQSPKHRVYPGTVASSGAISKDLADTRSIGSGPSSVSSDGSRTPLMSDVSETSSAGSTPRGSPKKVVKIPVAKPAFTVFGGYDAHGMLKETRKNGNGSDVKTDRESFRRKLEALNGSHVDSTKKRFELAQKRASVPLSSSLHSSREHSPSHSIDSDSSDRGRHTDSELSTRSPGKDVDIAAMFNSLRDGKVTGKATIVTLSGGKWSPPKGGSPRQQAATSASGQAQGIRYPLPPAGFLTPKQINEASKRGMEPIPQMRTPPSGRPFSAPINPKQLASFKAEHLSILPGQLPITKSKMQEQQQQQQQQQVVSVSPVHRMKTSPSQSPNRKQRESPRSSRTSFFSSDSSKSSPPKAKTPSQGGANNNNNQAQAQTQEEEHEQRRKEFQQKQQPLMQEMEQRLQQRRLLVEKQTQQQQQQQQQQTQPQQFLRQQTQPKPQTTSSQPHKTTTVTKKETTTKATKVAVLIPTDPIPIVPLQRPSTQMQPPSQRPTQAKQQKQPPTVHKKPTVHQKPVVQKRPLSQTQVTPQSGVIRKQQPPVPPAKPPRQSSTTSASCTRPSETLSQTHRPPVKSSPWSVSPSVPLPQHRHDISKSKLERPLSGTSKSNTLGSNSSGSKSSSAASTPSPESEKKVGGRGEKPLDRAAREKPVHANGDSKDGKDEKRAPKITFDEM